MTRIALAAALLIAAAGTAAAHAASPTQGDVGAFVRDQQGNVIGSLRAIDGDRATVLIGMVNTSGNHIVVVPVGALHSDGRQVVMNGVSPSFAAR